MPRRQRRPESSSSTSSTYVVGEEAGNGLENAVKEKRCKFWLPNKRRYCANIPVHSSPFCGNHDSSAGDRRLPCPLDPSHSVSKENLESHLKRCPLKKRAIALESQAYYSKGINSGFIDSADDDISTESKRRAIYGLNSSDFFALVKKIESLHSAVVGHLEDSYLMPEACEKWLRRQIDSKIPYQERHVMQQASIIGNMEKFGILFMSKDEILGSVLEEDEIYDFVRKKGELPAVVEFGAGRGYLTHMLADSYGIQRIYLVERRSYKHKADRSLRQNESILLERLRIDIEDLNLHAVESLNGHPYLAVGKHLCGNATDLTISCCCCSPETNLSSIAFSSCCRLQGIALATCCHHLCQWKHYSNKRFFLDHGLTKQDFYAVTCSSWAVDADHSTDLSDLSESSIEINGSEVNEAKKHFGPVEFFMGDRSVEEIIRNMKSVDRAAFGLKCKNIIDMGRVFWLREQGLDAELVNTTLPITLLLPLLQKVAIYYVLNCCVAICATFCGAHMVSTTQHWMPEWTQRNPTNEIVGSYLATRSFVESIIHGVRSPAMDGLSFGIRFTPLTSIRSRFIRGRRWRGRRFESTTPSAS
ncbi:tRNA:m(4)X modification enzyme TRM13 homolog [Phalaenopsis equestris]|uniref:tRNA:m(4)X modification enzyme TRM13 homolog n=1 Tax=Phalaenopsis equestris TaxID=78828 RepID=UPI0009E5E494|nr:tRNA:m(4)X modification enzyme TRM13 homolog [Phalaenopsis equestris]